MSSGQKSSVKEQGVVLFDWFDGGLVGQFVLLWFSPCSSSYLLLMGGKWKEYFFKTSAILLCVKVFQVTLASSVYFEKCKEFKW